MLTDDRPHIAELLAPGRLAEFDRRAGRAALTALAERHDITIHARQATDGAGSAWEVEVKRPPNARWRLRGHLLYELASALAVGLEQD